MQLNMFRRIHNLQIFDSIVGFIVVNMMNMLIRFKLPANKLFHYISMLKNSFTINSNPYIRKVSSCGSQCITFSRAKLFNVFSARRNIKNIFTSFTHDFKLSVINSFFTQYRFKSFGLSLVFRQIPKTVTRTCNGSFGSIWQNFKFFSTMFTNEGYHAAYQR